jgi:hypothetical protein
MARRWGMIAPMTTAMLSPPFTDPARLADVLRVQGHAALSPTGLAMLAGVEAEQLEALSPSWNDLPPDRFLRDGGHYRRRRHSCFVVEGGMVMQTPHRAHWQPVAYNALHGGLERWFEPVDPAVVAQPAWDALLRALAATCSALKGVRPWYVEAHQFRIDTTGGIGRPTPEGAHRDGVDVVVVLLVEREGRRDACVRCHRAHGYPLHDDRSLDGAAARRRAGDPRNHAHPASGARRAGRPSGHARAHLPLRGIPVAGLKKM